MNVDDLDKFCRLALDDFVESFKSEFEAAQAAVEAEAARPLRFPPAADRHQSIAATAQLRMMLMRQGEVNYLQWSFMGVPKHSSDKPLDQLKPIRIKEMQVTQVHKGRYLLCRIVSLPTRMVGVTFIVEDQDGRVETCSIYNLNLLGVSIGPDLDALFPPGAVLTVREPTYKPNQYNTCHVIRIDSPTDFEMLLPTHPLAKGARWSTKAPVVPLPAPYDFKALGNRYFGDKKDLNAVKAYTDGLAAKDDAAERLVLFLNRAQAHLRLGNYASAYRDTSAVLGFLDADVPAPPLAKAKATLRRARALEGMRQLTLAHEAYNRVLELDELSEEANKGARRVAKMLRESSTGEYDWRELVQWADKQDAQGGPAVGDFVGPVKVVEREGRGGGRGVVATRDLKAGEVLLVEKAFVAGYTDPKRIVMGFDLKHKKASDASKLALDRLLVASGGPPFADITRIENVCVVNTYGGSAWTSRSGGIYIVGIVGATVMPHAFYIGSKMATMRRLKPEDLVAELTPGTDAGRAHANALDFKALGAAGIELREPSGSDRIEILLLRIAARSAERGTARDDREAQRWIRAAAETARVLYGVDFDGFVERADEDREQFKLERLVPSCRT
ncbi:hypothetical protein JCM3770_005179 [Rhodotorula araucariae]